MANAGDSIIAGAFIALALILGLGAAGVPFMIWLGLVLLLVAGIMMVRGDLGANATLGYTMILAAPIIFMVPAFAPGLDIVLSGMAAFGLLVGAILKLTNVW